MYDNPKHYGIKQYYTATRRLYGALPVIAKNRKTNLISKEFVERLMLTVTQVNGCEACSYAHTKMAIEQGMSMEEIKAFLSGSSEFVREEEAPAILFAQHYADTDGRPDCDVYQKIVDTYGSEKTDVIVSAIEIMTFGNIIGIPLSALSSRLKKKPHGNSTLRHEIGLPLSTLFILPVAFIHFLIKRPSPLCEDVKGTK